MLDALNSPAFGLKSALMARVALAAALVLALLAGARVALLLVAGPPIELVPPVTLDAAQQSGPAPAQSVANWHLFGNASGPIDLAALAQAAPETVLKLVLRGTLNENAPEGGVAIIADETGADRAYRVGDTLPGDARLEGIYAGRVLLSRAGVNESLSLPRDADAPAAPRAVPGATRSPAGASARATNLPGSAQPAPFVMPSLAPGGPSLESLRAATGTDPMELAKQVQIFPVIENGRMAGVRLSVGRDSDLLARAGLQPSDLITAVNGIPLDGPQRQSELMNSLRDARQVQVTVRRDGKDMQLTLGL
jgi:general secretion pathway protein C